MRASRYPGQRRLWDRAKTTSTTQRLSLPGQSQRHLTEKSIVWSCVSWKSAFRNRSVMTLRNRSVMKKHTLTHSFRACVTKRHILRPSYHPDHVSL